MTTRVKQKTQEKWEAFHAMKRNNNNMTRNHYAKLKNQTEWEVRKAVRLYEKKIADESKQNPKAFYNYVKSKVKVKHGVPDLEMNDQVATTDSEKAEMLNTFYTSVFTHEDTYQVPVPDNVFSDEKLTHIEITEAKVKKILKKLNQNKSAGADKHHPRILKELQEPLLKPLTLLYQKSFEELGKLSTHILEGCQCYPNL